MESEIRETKGAGRVLGGETRRRALNRELLLRTALSIVDEEGLESLTLRALGKRPGVSQTAVYRHIPDKAALLDGIVEQIWRDVVAGLGAKSDAEGEESGGREDGGADIEGTPDFRQLARNYALSLRSTLLRHPNTAVLMATHPISTPEQYGLIASALHTVALASSAASTSVSDAVRQPNCRPADLTGLIQSVTVLTTGYVIAEVTKPVGGAGGEPSEAAMREAMLQSEELQQFLAPLADPERAWSMEREFERALNAMLDGWGVE
ncbi:MAG: TetR family transcriptional regulator [Bifidobacterium tibiigranuli]|uniref:TetR/AcrR family transcriptional regulator n=1 Tax=Bifidobacterium tibiigranuli TaxID=2172043 RepID=UPI0026EBD483|nr:TetR family transcriptional regulator [Bifidobacterium tibiigranuli]MCI1673669.1 TetR family transcriptional regulator [Bifidobacterium tibiigranuli]MCI1712925.1 TetR family transcriptional regulator [Bifidobacterium tibiigranuli]MCI1833568.1 TetR family transcriptional regulator [Bifidobacterium tibiigranuli]